MGQGPGDRHPLLLAPESWPGYLFFSSEMPISAKSRSRFLTYLSLSSLFAYQNGNYAFSKAVSVGMRLKNWNIYPIRLCRIRTSSPFRKGGYLAVIKIYPAGGGLVNTPQDIEERCLAGTGRADNRANSPWSISTVIPQSRLVYPPAHLFLKVFDFNLHPTSSAQRIIIAAGVDRVKEIPGFSRSSSCSR